MHTISIVIPCYNEEDNVIPLSENIISHIKQHLPLYDYEIIFIDNFSQDATRARLISLCSDNSKIKAIFNIRNFGQFNSPFYGLCQATGDCVISMSADFQDPVCMIERFVAEWEAGYQIVIGVKTGSKEHKIMYFLRSCYYKILKAMANVDIIEHFTGFGLYDKSFIAILRTIEDVNPFLRGIVAEIGGKRKEIAYMQDARKSGKSNNNFYTLYDAAMMSFTAYTKIGIRIPLFLGFFLAIVDCFVALFYFFKKILYWDSFPLGMAPLTIGLFLCFSIILIFIGLLGEYIISINMKLIKRPLVIEEKRINF